jgi:hypothetical protein
MATKICSDGVIPLPMRLGWVVLACLNIPDLSTMIEPMAELNEQVGDTLIFNKNGIPNGEFLV